MPAAPILAAVAVILEEKDTEMTTITPGTIFVLITIRFGYFFLFLPYGDDLTKVHLNIVDLSDEEGCQSFIQSRSVHVDGGAHRQHETRDSLVNFVVLLQTLEGDGERR